MLQKSKAKTGIVGLDDVLSGGLAAGHVFLLEGAPGTGKTTTALRFLIEGLSNGETCLYITLSETEEELRAGALSHGWNLEGDMHIFEVVPAESLLDADQQQSLLYSSDLELGETTKQIFEKFEAVDPHRVVIDSLSEIRLLAQGSLRYRRQILALKHYFARRKATVLLLDDLTADSRDKTVHSVVHGVIQLEELAPSYGAERRRLRVTKYRGQAFRGGYHDFAINTGGIEVFPRLIALEHRTPFSRDQRTSGIPALDSLLGGGLEQGSSTLILGPAGTGKSLFAIHFAIAAVQRGEKAALFLFDEEIGLLYHRMRGIGIDLEKLQNNGLLHIEQVDAAELSPGEAGVRAVNCRDIEAMCRRMGENTLFAVVTEEALLEADIAPLARFVRDQPAWSSLPFVILTRRGGGPERNPEAARLSEVLQNVTFLERPFHGTTFVSVARSARRSRLRQYEGRASEETLRASEAALRELNGSLEQRVAERTAELEKAHALVLAEIEQREQAEEILRQAQKMEVLGSFTGGVAHDFNNLLMAVISNLELLSKHLRYDEKAARLIHGAMQGAQRGASLTQRLLAFARRQELTLEARELCELVRASEQLLQHSVGDQHILEFDLPHSVPPALMDQNQFELALLNLVINARDATPDGGVIRIAVDHVPESVAGGHGTDFVRIRVEDKGHGMDATTLEQATQPFFSTKGLGKGTGLGLSMIHGLAVQLNGKLVLSSEPGVGTTAEIWLPASEEPVSPSMERQSTAPPPSTQDERPLRILFVDDDALIAMSSVEMLRDLGHHVTETYSGDQALAALAIDGHFDLMITDFSMPRMNGAELAKAARSLRPSLPILLATGFAELPNGKELDLPRLPKPYGQQQLRDEIRKLLA